MSERESLLHARSLAKSLRDEIPWTPCGHKDCESILRRAGELAQIVEQETEEHIYDRRERLRDAALQAVLAMDEFDNEALLSLLRPGRLAEIKHRLFEVRAELEEAADAVR